MRRQAKADSEKPYVVLRFMSLLWLLNFVARFIFILCYCSLIVCRAGRVAMEGAIAAALQMSLQGVGALVCQQYWTQTVTAQQAAKQVLESWAKGSWRRAFTSPRSYCVF